MTGLSFDTLRFAKRLEAAGVPTEQAEAQAAALADALDTGDLVTRKDLQIELAPIRADFAVLRGGMTMLTWRLGVVIAGVAAMLLKTSF